MKTIGELAALVPGAVLEGDAGVQIGAIFHDSRRQVKDGLFVCIPGATVDGHDYIAQAAANGAVCALVERDAAVPEGMARLKVADVRAAVRQIAPYFHDYPGRRMRLIGITGTNGKTTTSYLIRAILREAGYRVGLIGTIQAMIDDEALPVKNTTPDVIDLQELLAAMAERGAQYAVMEVSSHALDQERIAGCEFDTAVFTNVTQDHLDYHKTFENYIAAKAKLFALLGADGAVKTGKAAVVNADDAAGAAMLAACRCGATYGVQSGDLRAEDIRVTAQGASFTVVGAFGRLPLQLKITGIFNVYNTLAAVGAALAEGIAPETIRAALEKCTGVPGRFELVDAGQDFSVIVDYAHTPDGLENILKTARQIAERRIITVFGCGGDRDRTKRPIMGRIAAELSDVVIATSDNPRTEDPEFILSQVEEGVLPALAGKEHRKITDRRAAIFAAIGLARPGDIVVIAGKGHENYQILKDKTIHFDDKEVAREAIGGLE